MIIVLNVYSKLTTSLLKITRPEAETNKKSYN